MKYFFESDSDWGKTILFKIREFCFQMKCGTTLTLFYPFHREKNILLLITSFPYVWDLLKDDDHIIITTIL